MNDYPANEAAFRHVLDAAGELRAGSIIEAGIGTGTALGTWHRAGMTIAGFDNDPACVAAARARMAELGLDPAPVLLADARDAASLAGVPTAGQADVCVAMGVAPHCDDATQLVANLLSLVRPGGMVFIEFRNALFSLFTFNRYTYDFVMDDLLPPTTPELRDAAAAFLRERLAMDTSADPSPQSQFHNPLTIEDELAASGATGMRVLPFHYHAAMPAAAGHDRPGFLGASWSLEDRPIDWRSLFVCSAFLLQATRPLEQAA